MLFTEILREMTYTYIDSNTFKGVTRGANGTDAFPHDTGATIAEIQTEYFFIMAHPMFPQHPLMSKYQMKFQVNK